MNGKSTSKKILKIGYSSPAWPPRALPNGIITYIQYMLDGFNANVKPIIFTNHFYGLDKNEIVIDYSNQDRKISHIEKYLDKVMYRIHTPYSQHFLFNKRIKYAAQSLALAINQLKEPLDIFEVEESHGIPNFLVKESKTPIVTRLHGPWFIHGPIMLNNKDSEYKIKIFLEGEGIKKSHGITSPSLDVLEKTREFYNIELPDALVIPNAVPAVSAENQWRYDLNVTPSILVVGRFDLHKGGDLAVDAFRIIALINRDVELVFVGPDRGVNIKNESITFNDYISRTISEEHIKKRIKFLGHCDLMRVSELRKKSTVTILCSRYENFPMSLLEALSAGSPTIATAVGGIKEIVVNNYNGLLAEPESAESIAEKALSLLESPEKMQLLSKNAISDCKARFSPTLLASQTVDYYLSVLDKLQSS